MDTKNLARLYVGVCKADKVGFKSFLPSVYKFGMVCTLVYRCLCILSNWTQFHTELTFLKGIFQRMVTLKTLLTNVLKSF